MGHETAKWHVAVCWRRSAVAWLVGHSSGGGGGSSSIIIIISSSSSSRIISSDCDGCIRRRLGVSVCNNH